ncbi:acetyl-coenzyme A synthetase N-terminal domain-containing protein [Streptomyces sp. NPDC002814]
MRDGNVRGRLPLEYRGPESFWLKAAEGIDWDVAPQRALDSSGAPFYRWFPDGRLNVAFNALDRHIEAGRGEQPALVYDSPVTGTRRTPADRRIRDLRSLTVPPGPVSSP